MPVSTAKKELAEFSAVPETRNSLQFDTPSKGEQQDSLPIVSGLHHDQDTNTLARLGKRQVLKVRYFPP